MRLSLSTSVSDAMDGRRGMVEGRVSTPRARAEPSLLAAREQPED